jgi:hypothetical protein
LGFLQTLILGVPQEVNLMPMLQLHLLLVQTHQLGVDAEDTAAEGEDGESLYPLYPWNYLMDYLGMSSDFHYSAWFDFSCLL